MTYEMHGAARWLSLLTALALPALPQQVLAQTADGDAANESSQAPLSPTPLAQPPDPAPEVEAVPVEEATAPAPPTLSAKQRLDEADARLLAGDVDQARHAYIETMRLHPSTTEAKAAERAINIIDLLRARAATPAKAGSPIDAPAAAPEASERHLRRRNDETFYTLEPYSTVTAERLRLTWWEKIDFSITSFLYGMSVGFSYTLAIAPTNNASAIGPIVAGAGIYTMLGIAFLALANPDRGDLPLALAIASYVPTSLMLFLQTRRNWVGNRTQALLIALAGTVAVPAAAIATMRLNLDPGDTQLVRDAGFWGLSLSILGMIAFGGTHRCWDRWCSYQPPSTEAIAFSGLLGLIGGLSLGTGAALYSEVSLERVRVATWGGYGGILIGALIGSASDTERGAWVTTTIGGILGLLVTFVATPMIDEIPDDADMIGGVGKSWMPTVVSLVDSHGEPSLGLGISLALP